MALTSKRDLDELIQFQKELINLSNELDNIYEFLNNDLTNLSYSWEDQKFFEFEENMAPKKDEIRKISEYYRTWASTSLQKTIENLEEYLGASTGL